jgi:hypothetical protein
MKKQILALGVFFIIALILSWPAGAQLFNEPIKIQKDWTLLLTYRWKDVSPHITGKTKIDHVGLDKNIRTAINDELFVKGYNLSESANADFVVDYAFEVSTEGKEVLPAFRDERPASYQEETKGELTVSFYDPKTNEVFWRHSASGSVYREALLRKKKIEIEDVTFKALDPIPSR